MPPRQQRKRGRHATPPREHPAALETTTPASISTPPRDQPAVLGTATPKLQADELRQNVAAPPPAETAFAKLRIATLSLLDYAGTLQNHFGMWLRARRDSLPFHRPGSKARAFLDYCSTLDIAVPPEPDRGRLSLSIAPLDTERLIAEIEEVARALAKGKGINSKERHPLPCIVGTSGQGKTEVLEWITGVVPGIDVPNRIKGIFAAVLSNSSGMDQCVDPTAEPICLFVTFTQGTTFDEGEGAEQALVSRAACWYMGRHWNTAVSERASQIGLDDLLEEIRRREGEKSPGIGAKMIILAVDEVRQVSSHEKRRELLQVIGSVMQAENADGKPFFPVVSCLDVEGVFQAVSTGSKRPLLSIKLLPCREKDIEVILSRSIQNGAWSHMDLATTRHNFFATNGHYRSLEELLRGTGIRWGNAKAFPKQLQLLRIIYSDGAMYPWLGETHNVFEKDKSQAPETLYECAMDLHSGIFYAEANTEKRVVAPQMNFAIVVNAMNDKEKSATTKAEAATIAFLRAIIRMMGMVDSVKGIELIIPRLLVLRAALQEESWSVEQLLRLYVSPTAGFLKPLFRGWGDADIGSLRTSLLTLGDLAEINSLAFSDDISRPSWKTGHKLITSTWEEHRTTSPPGIRFAFPAVSTYPGIEGVIFGLLETVRASKPIPLAVQMKCYSEANPGAVVKWARKAHEQMQGTDLGFKAGEYYVLICAKNLPTLGKGLPEGTIAIGEAFMQALCRPFGLESSLLEMLRAQK